MTLAACNATVPSNGGTDTAGEASDGASATGPGATSTTGAGGCPDSDLPDPFCYKGHDVSSALGDNRFTVIGTGRFGEDGAPALLLAKPTSLHFGFWDLDTEQLQIELAAEGPDDAQWDGMSGFFRKPAIAAVSSSVHDDVILLHESSFWHFAGATGALGDPTLSAAHYEDDDVEYTWSAARILETIDVDGDGRSELVVRMGRFAQLWRHESAGWKPWGALLPQHLHDPDEPAQTCGRPLAAHVEDLDDDGREDLVLLFDHHECHPLDPTPEAVVTVLLNDAGTPDGFLPSYWPHGGIIGDVIFLDTGDLDGSGALDILVAGTDDTRGSTPIRVHALRGHGDGTFDAPLELLPNAFPLAAVDLSRDHVSELLAAPRDDEGPRVHALVSGLHDPTLVDLGVGSVSLVVVSDLNDDGAPELISDRLYNSPDARSHVLYLSNL